MRAELESTQQVRARAYRLQIVAALFLAGLAPLFAGPYVSSLFPESVCYFFTQSQWATLVGWTLSAPFIGWACCIIAKKKGYGGFLALFSLLSCFGLLMLVLLPQRNDRNILSTMAAPVCVVAVVVPPFVLLCPGSFRQPDCRTRVANQLVDLKQALALVKEDLRQRGMHLTEEEVANELVTNNGLQYLYGPYYGWRGTCSHCRVLMRMVKTPEGVVMEAACEGLRSEMDDRDGKYDRLGWRMSVSGDAIPHSFGVSNVRDAKNGNTQEWNSYGSEDGCFVESIVKDVGANAKPRFEVKVPKRIPTESLDEYLQSPER